VAVGLQADANPVKCVSYLDATSCTLQGTRTIKQYETLGNGRKITKSGVGPHTVGGDIAFNFTPDKVSQILYAILGRLDGNTSTAAPITHVLRPSNIEGQPALRPLTVEVRRGDSYFVYPNCYAERLVLRPSEDDDLTATVTLAGLALERVYDAPQVDPACAASSLMPFAFHGATVKQCAYGEVLAETELTSGWNLEISTGFASRRQLGNGLVAGKGRPGRSRVRGSFDLIFESDAELKRWMGDSSTVYPKSPGTHRRYLAMQIAYTHADTNATLTIDVPRALYEGEATPATESAEGFLIQPLQFVTEWDSVMDCDVKLTLVNSETNAVITKAGTKIA